MTGLYLYVGFARLQFVSFKAEQQAQRQKEQSDMKLYAPAGLARPRIVSLSACLLQNRMLHPEAAYPKSLDSLPAGQGCERAPAANMIPEFTFAYTPQLNASGQVIDFQLTAIPKAKGVLNRNPLLIDSRGIVFVDYPWEMANVLPKVMVMPSDREYSQIDALKLGIESYAKDKTNGAPPAALSAEITAGLGHERPSIEDQGMRLETRDFEIRYFAPAVRGQNKFAVSVQCKSYAQNCLRSYFLARDGIIHATGEPRPATASDPLSPQCEQGFSECNDVVWSVP